MASPAHRSSCNKSNKRRASKYRHYVQHDYRDHAQTTAAQAALVPQKKRRGGVAVHFPVRLYEAMMAIEADGHSHVMGWQPHGRCFVIHKPHILERELLSKYFAQSKLTSFQRQLNLYSFQRLTRGPDAGGYYHELFLRGKPFLAHNIYRQTIKGTKIKAAANPNAEPDFYQMRPVYYLKEEPQSFLSSTSASSAKTAQPKRTLNPTTHLTSEQKQTTHHNNKHKSIVDNNDTRNNSFDSEVETDKSDTSVAVKSLDNETCQDESLPVPSTLNGTDILAIDAHQGGAVKLWAREDIKRKGHNETENMGTSLGKCNDSSDSVNYGSQAMFGSLGSYSSSSSPPSPGSALRPPPVLAPSWYLPIRPCDVDSTDVPSVPLHIFAYGEDGHEEEEEEDDADIILGGLDWTRELPSDFDLSSTLLDFINDQAPEHESITLTCL